MQEKIDKDLLYSKQEVGTFKRICNKYGILLDDTVNIEGHTLYRLVALTKDGRNFFGDHFDMFELGGYIEEEYNLDTIGSSWIGSNSVVYNKGRVLGNSIIKNNVVVNNGSEVIGNAIVKNNCTITNNTVVLDDSLVSNNVTLDNCTISGNSVVKVNVKIENTTAISSKIRSSITDSLSISDTNILLSNIDCCGSICKSVISANSNICIDNNRLNLDRVTVPSNSCIDNINDLVVISKFLRGFNTLFVMHKNIIKVSYGSNCVDINVRTINQVDNVYEFEIESNKLTPLEEEALKLLLGSYFRIAEE